MAWLRYPTGDTTRENQNGLSIPLDGSNPTSQNRELPMENAISKSKSGASK
jgi:hypothetical protein